jgi:hypothetical protein
VVRAEAFCVAGFLADGDLVGSGFVGKLFVLLKNTEYRRQRGL